MDACTEVRLSSVHGLMQAKKEQASDQAAVDDLAPSAAPLQGEDGEALLLVWH